MRFTIGKKLTLGFVSILLLLLLIGVGSINALSKMGEEARVVDNQWMPGVMLLGGIQTDFIQIERLALRYVIETDATERDQLETQISTTITHLQKAQNEYKALITSQEERELFDHYVANEQELVALLPTMLKDGKANQLQGVNQIADAMKPLFNQGLDLLTTSIHKNADGAQGATAAAIQVYETGKMITILLIIIALALGSGIALFLTRMIAKPMVRMAGAAERIASGDLTTGAIHVKNRDEIGDLAKAFNEMSQSLRRLIREVGTSAEQVAASAQELTASSEQISASTEQIALTMEKVAVGSEKQTRNIDESVKSMNEMSVGVQHIATYAEKVTEAAIQASEIAVEGNQTIRITVNQMNSINHTVMGLAQAVRGLGERSQEIGKIVEVITGIASQTNLLALNAAIEAARVGEYGTGFAVVAKEVRKLAEQSGQSAEQIAQLITAIQGETSQAVGLMEAGTKEVAEGIHVVHRAGEAFDQIQGSVKSVANQIQEVSAASEQMFANTEQVVHSTGVIMDIAEITSTGTKQVSSAIEEQLASMEEITASAAALSQMSEELQSLIGKFKV